MRLPEAAMSLANAKPIRVTPSCREKKKKAPLALELRRHRAEERL
jgi:hypothetical protein